MWNDDVDASLDQAIRLLSSDADLEVFGWDADGPLLTIETTDGRPDMLDATLEITQDLAA